MHTHNMLQACDKLLPCSTREDFVGMNMPDLSNRPGGLSLWSLSSGLSLSPLLSLPLSLLRVSPF